MHLGYRSWVLGHGSSLRASQRRNLVQAQIFKSDIELRPISKVLIANRGEIACRVIKTARKLGIQTVAVYSDADRRAMHVEMADEAYHIGPAASQQSYLNASKILDVAKISKSQAVHPGYGFLSENLEFSERCKNEGIIFIGPPCTAIRDMGIKSTSKAIMSAAGVPIIEGYHGEDQALERLQKEAQKIGFPLMIKAVRGGGGKGMRIALTEKDFLEALDSAKRESLKAFGDDNVLLEQYVSDPRHVEVQVFADMHGNAVHLFERDCSVQRRHQKIIEEAPAPGLSADTRLELGSAAVRAAKAVGYVGAGTVEFILDRKTHSFHFMEMNTRLQVEHPITEMITGTDLVEWQLRIASGEPLPLAQSDIVMSGHAFESRIYAEDPSGGFLPGAGPLKRLSVPQDASEVRVETGVRQGDDVSVHYDPMIAKLVVWGKDRREALARMTANLADYQIVGLETNVNFLLELCRNKSFQDGDVHTAFIEHHKGDLFPGTALDRTTLIHAALAKILSDKRNSETLQDWKSKGLHMRQASWRPNYSLTKKLSFTHNKQDFSVEIIYGDKPKSFKVRSSGEQWSDVDCSLREEKDRLVLTATIDGAKSSSNVVLMDGSVYIFNKVGKTVLDLVKPKFLTDISKEPSSHSDQNTARSPMPGVLDKMFAKANSSVKKGDSLFVIIAMKMEYVVRAPRDGIIEEVTQTKIGESVAKNSVLVRFKEDQ